MHPQAFSYAAKALAAEGIKGKRILEIGSLDVNSTEQGLSLRDFCDSALMYWGIDEQDGPGVDQAATAAKYDGKGKFDIVISTEALEHTPEPRDILDCAWRALKPGGVLVLTCAGPGRAPHNCDGGAWAGVEHYANIEPDALRGWLADGGWRHIAVEYNDVTRDVYATATKLSGEQTGHSASRARRSPSQ